VLQKEVRLNCILCKNVNMKIYKTVLLRSTLLLTWNSAWHLRAVWELCADMSFVCVCHHRDHPPLNPDDLLWGNQLPAVCPGWWIHVLLLTQQTVWLALGQEEGEPCVYVECSLWFAVRDGTDWQLVLARTSQQAVLYCLVALGACGNCFMSACCWRSRVSHFCPLPNYCMRVNYHRCCLAVDASVTFPQFRKRKVSGSWYYVTVPLYQVTWILRTVQERFCRWWMGQGY
jgi:hypothetical protein